MEEFNMAVKIRLKRMGAKKTPFDAEKAKKWIANGAQPTDTVRDLLKKNNII